MISRVKDKKNNLRSVRADTSGEGGGGIPPLFLKIYIFLLTYNVPKIYFRRDMPPPLYRNKLKIIGRIGKINITIEVTPPPPSPTDQDCE